MCTCVHAQCKIADLISEARKNRSYCSYKLKQSQYSEKQRQHFLIAKNSRAIRGGAAVQPRTGTNFVPDKVFCPALRP